MKIFYIANARIPTEKAHGFQICKMCEQLSLQGAEVELIVSKRNNTIIQDVFQYYDLKKVFTVRVLKVFDVIQYNKLFFKKAMWLQRIIFLIRLFFVKLPSDAIVFTRDPEVVWLMNKKGNQAIYECHDGIGRFGKFINILIRDGKGIITTNQHIAEQFINSGIAEDKILTLPHGVDMDLFALDMDKITAVNLLNLDDSIKSKIISSTVLMYIGNYKTMGNDKGINDILYAMQDLDAVKYFFVAVGGTDNDIKYYAEIVSRLGVENNVLFVGRQSQRQLGIWQQVADILMMPFPDIAHYRHHMTPLKMFEYMASQRPIIASDLPSIRSILDEEAAFFVKPGNIADIVNVTLKIISNPSEGQSRATQALQQVKKYSWDSRAMSIIDFIQKQ